MTTKKRIMITLLCVAAAIAVVMIVSAIVCSVSIKVTGYEMPMENLDSEIKIVCISDLHSREFGEDNENLTSLIAAQEPDAVFVNGDMISRNADDTDVDGFLSLMRTLTELAPVFYSTGNHEVEYMENNGEELLDRIAETGAVVLYDSFVETEIAGSVIRIGGTSGHYRNVNWTEQNDYAMQEEIGSTDIPALVMMHMPENMFADSARKNWNADLYISGHTHGGLVRLPIIGGLVSPGEGLFPKYDYGQYLIDGRLNLIISSGFAGYKFIPRVFNRPEICVIRLTCCD